MAQNKGNGMEETERSGGSSSGIKQNSDPEVSVRAARRRFTTAYKSRIAQEADSCEGHGAIGALLRREGLYSSQLYKWREQLRTGGLNGLSPKKRGRKGKTPDQIENERLLRENQKLQKKLEQAELIIDIQKKVACLLRATAIQETDDKS